jgi:hypothetical protein
MKRIKNMTALALVAVSVLLALTTRADDAHSDATITWTKHVTAFLPPGGDIFATIGGVVAGDVGEGTVVGDAFGPVQALPDGNITFTAEYRVAGAKHSCILRFRVVQAPDKSGVMIGMVADGWLRGNAMTGRYTARTCDEGVNLTCFDGTFTIDKGSKARN